jgi:UDP-N-acetyl-D-galactosamine dehydrogenase
MKKISIIGIGYVGLPLAYAFSKHYKVIAYDNNEKRVIALNNRNDENKDLNLKSLDLRKNLHFTSNKNEIAESDFIIITVPTPVNKKNNPNLIFLKNSCELISPYIKKGSIIVFESTVYPGVVEEYCGKIIEKNSKLKKNKDFYLGYSPERINPGDNLRTLTKINKIVSGSNSFALNKIYRLYKKIITSKVFKTKSIKTAEAAKVIENIQRDLNIGLMNELYLLFNKTNINFKDVLDAASTKWNFIKFSPGLVGGHCIGVDPYYLTYFAKKNKFKSNLVLSARKTNDNMSYNLSNIILNKLKKSKSKKKRVLILGFSFKENCMDIRNTKVFDLINNLKSKGILVNVVDPVVSKNEVKKTYGLKISNSFLGLKKFDLIFVAVKHDYFKKFGKKFYVKKLKTDGFFYDFKNIFS